MRHPCGCVILVWLALSWQSALNGAEYFAAPNGEPRADGSATHPWDLQSALDGHPDQQGRLQVRPGDTIWLRGGTYRGGFDCRVAGTEEAPVTVRAFPGERVTIDCRPRDDGRDSGLFNVLGAFTILWGLELTCSDPKRKTDIPGSWPEDIQRGGLSCRGHHVKLINLDLHDTGSGVGFWSEGHGGEMSGCLIHHNGWIGPDRTHGHGIYAQNESGQKRLVDNVVFNQFSHGIHCYGSAKAKLDNFDISGNVCFSNGCYDPQSGPKPGIFVGGEAPSSKIQIANNFLYRGSLTCGYPWGKVNHDVTVTDNEIADGGLTVRNFRTITCLRNTLIAPGMMVQFDNAEPVDWPASNWNSNRYVRTTSEYQPFGRYDGVQSRGFSLAEWRSATGFDADSQYQEGQPTGTKVFVRPNHYEPGRGHVIVYNWDLHDHVTADLTEVLKRGQNYRVMNVRDFYGEPVARGQFDGKPVAIPMRDQKFVPAVGLPVESEPTLGPTFGVFVVLPEGSD